jgi:hypothetical protein
MMTPEAMARATKVQMLTTTEPSANTAITKADVSRVVISDLLG